MLARGLPKNGQMKESPGMRNRLFLSWFEKDANKERFKICKAYTSIEGQG